MSTRKEELQAELKAIQDKEIAKKLQELSHLEESVDSQIAIEEAKSHKFVMKGDFWIKLLSALGITGAFFYVAITSHHAGMNAIYSGSENSSLLSVLGPLFGIVLQYYFGKSKAGANGE